MRTLNTSASALPLIFAALLSSGCVAQSVIPQTTAATSTENPSAQTTTNAPEQKPYISVRVDPISREAAMPKIDDLYLRLVAVPASEPKVTTMEFDKKKMTDQLWTAAKNLVFKKDEVVLAAVSGKISGQDFGTRSLMLINPADASSPTYTDHFLTPYFRTSDTLEVQWTTGDTVTTKSNAVSALVLTLGALSAVYAPQGAIFKAISTGSKISEKTKAVDAELDKVFSGTTLKSTSLKTYEPGNVDHFDVYFNDKKMVVVRIDFRESLISPDGKALSISTRSAEILGKKLEGSGEVSTILAKDADVMAALNKNTGSGFSEFCRRAAIALASNGFNVVDRSAILYAYLVDSQWNSSASMRKSEDCEREISYGSSQLKLKPTSELQAVIDKQREKAIEQMKKSKTGIWDKLSGKLGRPTADVWESIADDSVVLTSVKYDLTLTDSISLQAGVPQTFTNEEARNIFTDAQLKFDKERAISDGVIDENCYSVKDTATSSFRGFCFYPKNSNKPMMMEFDFTNIFSSDGPSPKLKSIKFFPTRT